jgi:hypothetical protein
MPRPAAPRPARASRPAFAPPHLARGSRWPLRGSSVVAPPCARAAAAAPPDVQRLLWHPRWAGRGSAASRAGGRRHPEMAAVGRAFPSWKRSTLTEIYLCHACSDHAIEDGHASTGGGRWGCRAASSASSWPSRSTSGTSARRRRSRPSSATSRHRRRAPSPIRRRRPTRPPPTPRCVRSAARWRPTPRCCRAAGSSATPASSTTSRPTEPAPSPPSPSTPSSCARYTPTPDAPSYSDS